MGRNKISPPRKPPPTIGELRLKMDGVLTKIGNLAWERYRDGVAVIVKNPRAGTAVVVDEVKEVNPEDGRIALQVEKQRAELFGVNTPVVQKVETFNRPYEDLSDEQLDAEMKKALNGEQ